MFNKYKSLYWGAKEEIAKLTKDKIENQKEIKKLNNKNFSLDCEKTELKTITIKQKDEIAILKKSIKEKDAIIEEQTIKINDLETKLKNARGHLKRGKKNV